MPSISVLDGELGVARALDPLEQDRAVPVRADERQLVPAQAGVLEDARERDAGRQRGDLRRHGHSALEDRVARVVRDALVLEEGRVPAVQVERPPAEQRRVERDDQVGVAGRLGTAQEGHGQLVVRWASRAGTSASRRRWPPPRPPSCRRPASSAGTSARARPPRGRWRGRRPDARASAPRPARRGPARACASPGRWWRDRPSPACGPSRRLIFQRLNAAALARVVSLFPAPARM